MGNLTAAGPLKKIRTIEKFLLLRMIITAFVVGAGVIIAQLTDERFPVRPLYILLILSVVLGGVCHLGFRFGLAWRRGLWAIMVADILLVTAIVHYSGGVTSPFSLVYCLSIVAAAYFLEVHGGLGVALLASCSFIAYGVMESKGVVTLPSSQGFSPPSADTWIVTLYLHVSIFFLVGIVAGYLSQRMKLKGEQLESAESELKQLKIDTDNILRNMSSGVLVVDSTGKILALNPAAEEILGFSREEIQSKYLDDAFSEVMPELMIELLSALNSEENKFRQEIMLNNNQGKKIPLGISISLLRDGGGKRGVIAVFQDLTEVREMQERIRKADRLAAIGELSAAIAHEIRNPLASITGSIEMLHNELKLRGEHRRLMQLISKESERLDRIISDFLEFARMKPPAIRNASIDRCIDDVVALLGNSAIGNKIGIDVRQRVEGARVKVDEEQIRQVFLNICLNACEAMRGEGDLTIEVSLSEDDRLCIKFQDEGPGIGEEECGHLFDPFFTTKEGGTGLGLAIANKIIEAHGGRIIYRNREVGGAEFDVVLPLTSIDRTDNVHASLEETTYTS
ncbi:MAG: PAS domain S-box protein [Candidatus Latescibacteria bacterium]|nr:PAS domain S-box protein [Candidatus Latescibacterota bacterium]NIM21007.1 PAS domain S-box protein [Candidatus Latescibacterota bacterium]NIM65142.1 PAS domain S-box protein [Candidatus Latescibacterota bacterium]NIO01657.1 PAS domain S-box protein [Candidatus Latescibacterota bacterium]NIO28174.1 PAS domain S-box protein [Candidatus Latescibacterota bacterium]